MFLIMRMYSIVYNRFTQYAKKIIMNNKNGSNGWTKINIEHVNHFLYPLS